MPVRADGASWLLSLEASVDNLLHASDVALSANTPRAVTLPALRPTMADRAAAIAARPGVDAALVRYDPDPVIDLQFARHPPLLTPAADALGFRHDGDLGRLVERVLATIQSQEATA